MDTCTKATMEVEEININTKQEVFQEQLNTSILNDVSCENGSIPVQEQNTHKPSSPINEDGEHDMTSGPMGMELNSQNTENDEEEMAKPLRYVIKKTLKYQMPAASMEPLPEGWISVAHVCGLPVYLHRQSKVVTWSRPYVVTIEMGGVKRHEVPVTSIPCLDYFKTKQNIDDCLKRAAKEKDIDHDQPETNGLSQTSTDSSNSSLSNCPVKDSSTSSSDKDSSESCSVTQNGDVSSSSASSQDKPINGCSNELFCNGTSSLNGGSTSGSTTTSSNVPNVILHEAKNQYLGEEEFNGYLNKRFLFETTEIPHFEKWADKRKYNRMQRREANMTKSKQDSDPKKLGPAKVITLTIPKDGNGIERPQKVVFNTSIKPMVCVLHEYAQSVLRSKPQYIFTTKDNPGEPFEAMVVLGDKTYGIASAANKKSAKNEAALATMEMLVPGFKKQVNDMEENKSLEYFNDVSVTDTRVYDLCVHSGNFFPYQLLTECLKRNQGIADTSVRFDVQVGKSKMIEYKMECGKHTVTGTARNKKTGKQQAAQQILKLLHPNVKSWGELIRTYGTSVVEKRERKKNMEQEIFMLKQRKSNQTKTEVATERAFSDDSDQEEGAKEGVTSRSESRRAKAKEKKEGFVANPELLAKLKEMMLSLAGEEQLSSSPPPEKSGKRKIAEEAEDEDDGERKKLKLLEIDV